MNIFIKSTSNKANSRDASMPRYSKQRQAWNDRAKEINGRIARKWAGDFYIEPEPINPAREELDA